MHRYFVAVWDSSDGPSTTKVASVEAALLVPSSAWKIVYRIPGLSVIHIPPNRKSAVVHLLAQGQGVVLGSLFPKIQSGSVDNREPAFDDLETKRIADSEGRHLVENYWGSYIAIVKDSRTGACALLRDPTATLACYHTVWGRIHVFFSDMEDFRRYVPVRLGISWERLGARLLSGDHLSRECALEGLEDVPGGERLVFSESNERRTVLWHPGQFCGANGLDDPLRATEELRSTVLSAVHTLAAQHSDILLRLSGGLDSSIVASCLAKQRSKPNVTCLNFFIATKDDPHARLPPGLSVENQRKLRRIIGGADERPFARSVANACGFPLVEKERKLCEFDLQRIWKAPLSARPSMYIYILDQDDAEMEFASTTRATACFTGEGGDTVFFNTLRVVGSVDYAYLHPFGPQLFRHVALTASLSGESAIRVFWKTVRHGLCGASLPIPYDRMKRPHLLKDDVARRVSAAYTYHPWVQVAPRLCPGKRDHVVGVATSVPMYHHVFHREQIAECVHPLASQPVVETCLRIPTYVLLANGTSRGLARLAFRDLLPADVVRRTGKGASIAFWQQLIRRNMAFVKECLLDGILVREGLLDRHKLEGYLIEEQPFLTVQPQQIMDYLAAEVWAGQCTSR